MDAESADKMRVGVETDDRSAPVIEPDVAPKHELVNARRSSLKAIETGGEFKRKDKYAYLLIISNVTRPADPHSADLPLDHLYLCTTTLATFTEAKPANIGVETDDRSAAVIEADLAPAHDVAKARRGSLSQIADSFKDMDAESAAKLNEGVETDDRSAPQTGHAEAAEARESHLEARRSSLSQIDNNFVGMDEDSAAKLNIGVETNDKSAPVIEAEVDLNPAAELAKARKQVSRPAPLHQHPLPASGSPTDLMYRSTRQILSHPMTPQPTTRLGFNHSTLEPL
jgi:hypothetical protein